MHVRCQWRTTFALFVLFFCVSFFALPSYSYAANLTLTPATGSVSAGAKISVKVMLDPGSDSVNASDGSLSFDSALLSVDSISKDGSVFSLWTADPVFSNSAGTISFSGGTPTAFSSVGKILTIVFKGKAVGVADVAFTKGSVLAADGKGTDVYKNGTGTKLTVTAASAPTPKPDPAPAPPPAADTQGSDAVPGDGATPIAPIISSATYSKLDTWYGTSTAVFSWVLTSDITSVRTLLSDKDNQAPKVALKGGATTTQRVTGIKDGISYFYVQGKNDFGWGEVGKFKIQVDTVPPLVFEIGLQEPGTAGGPSKLTFKTDDPLSGMDHYELGVGTSTPTTINAKDITDGTYPVPPQGGGLQHVVVRAFDKAGNKIEVTKDLTLPAVLKPKAASVADETPVASTSSGFGIAGYLLVLFALITGGLIAMNMYSKKTAKREKEKLLQAVLEVRDKNDRIFSAMREEFEQLVNNFDEKPQLTPQERDLLESIKEVLDISEELVDTSIEDLKKLVRNQP